jgi:hypothetical protein
MNGSKVKAAATVAVKMVGRPATKGDKSKSGWRAWDAGCAFGRDSYQSLLSSASETLETHVRSREQILRFLHLCDSESGITAL